MNTRRTGRALVAGGLLVAVLTAGCGVRPSAVITGRAAVSGPTEGIGIYLLAQGDLALVLRQPKATQAGVTPAVTCSPSAPGGSPCQPAQALALLAAGPSGEERASGLTSEVPAGLGPFTVKPAAQRSDLTVKTTGAVGPLTADAFDQIVCTVTDSATQVGLVNGPAAVSIVGPDGARQPRRCPIR
ncbi:hypothetical protein [Micromonospora chokoriensis]|uniref:Sporulation and spore germination n=1 Tax=Micromonospora chokoriensis TaxID=356851 RepID=A0A1C4XQS3_9ACTN|nr:hypothetical protein [Micromonospora chokoriensis]SCF10880.1 hypothetical protein GA0070612_3861 [Micromonospora chokoriensis]